ASKPDSADKPPFRFETSAARKSCWALCSALARQCSTAGSLAKVGTAWALSQSLRRCGVCTWLSAEGDGEAGMACAKALAGSAAAPDAHYNPQYASALRLACRLLILKNGLFSWLMASRQALSPRLGAARSATSDKRSGSGIARHTQAPTRRAPEHNVKAAMHPVRARPVILQTTATGGRRAPPVHGPRQGLFCEPSGDRPAASGSRASRRADAQSGSHRAVPTSLACHPADAHSAIAPGRRHSTPADGPLAAATHHLGRCTRPPRAAPGHPCRSSP